MKYLKESEVQPQVEVHFGDWDHYLRKEKYGIYLISYNIPIIFFITYNKMHVN